MTLVQAKRPLLQNLAKQLPQQTNQVGFGNKIPQSEISRFTSQQAITQGFRQTIITGKSDSSYVLTSPGRRMLGVSINVGTLSTIAEIYTSISINGYSLVTYVNALQLCPNYVQGMVFFETPYMLVGNDNIKVDFDKNDAGTVIVGFNFHYLPQVPQIQ